MRELTGRTELKSVKRTFFDARKSSLDKKISLKGSALWVSPAWQAGVLTFRPNVKAR